MITSMKQVPFYGSSLEATKVGDKVWVSVRRMCEGIGLDYSGQHQRLSDTSRSPWATTVIVPMYDTMGRVQNAFCLDLDSVPMWLATIDSNRVGVNVLEKVILFQREAANALRDHFFGLPKEAVIKTPTSFLEALRLAADLEEKRIDLEHQIKALGPKAEFYDQVASSVNTASIGAVAKALGYGRNTFFECLREAGILEKTSNLPLQVHITAGRFEVNVGTQTNGLSNKTNFTSRVTGKGFIFLAKKFGEAGETYKFPAGEGFTVESEEVVEAEVSPREEREASIDRAIEMMIDIF